VKRGGFTLLEILVSIVILAMALTVAWQTFAAVTGAWKRSKEMLDTVHHGDYVIQQLAGTLRSMVIFDSTPEKYAFQIENNGAGYGEHTISFVTAGKAFIPPGTQFEYGLHRLRIGIGHDEEGNEGFTAEALPHLVKKDEYDPESWFISGHIKGLRCRLYDLEEERWTDTWEYSNSLPGLIEITLIADSPEEYGEPVEFCQLIEIPLGPEITNIVSEAN